MVTEIDTFTLHICYWGPCLKSKFTGGIVLKLHLSYIAFS